MAAQERERPLPLDDVPADEEFDLRPVADSQLRVESADLGVLEGDVLIQPDAVGMPAFDPVGTTSCWSAGMP